MAVADGLVNLKLIFTTVHETKLLAPSFTTSLAEVFVQSRKFDVLERARLKEVLKEIDFGEGDYADHLKAVPIGKALNAEYVVLPQVELVHLVAEMKDIPYVDQKRLKFKAKMVARLRVVDVATTKVVSAFTEETQVERTPKRTDSFTESESNSLVLDMYRTQSLRMLHRTLEAIYPVRILDADGKTVVLNRGEGAVKEGDEFDVFELGKAYTDPDTGEDLGRGEKLMGKVRVVRVKPKFCEAEILEGADELKKVPRDYVCRETRESIKKKTTVSSSPIAW
jgi:hypothetical protein